MPRILFAIILLGPIAGCMTATTLVDGRPGIYSGVQADIDGIREPSKYLASMDCDTETKVLMSAAFSADLLLSAVADTIVLPFTLHEYLRGDSGAEAESPIAQQSQPGAADTKPK